VIKRFVVIGIRTRFEERQRQVRIVVEPSRAIETRERIAGKVLGCECGARVGAVAQQGARGLDEIGSSGRFSSGVAGEARVDQWFDILRATFSSCQLRVFCERAFDLPGFAQD
jgi:hypothetical protein